MSLVCLGLVTVEPRLKCLNSRSLLTSGDSAPPTHTHAFLPLYLCNTRGPFLPRHALVRHIEEVHVILVVLVLDWVSRCSLGVELGQDRTGRSVWRGVHDF